MNRILTLTPTVAFTVLSTFAAGQEPLRIGARLELFVDDALIEGMTNAALRLREPIPRDVALVHDRPWEGNVCAYHTVFQDGDLFRMYYRGAHFDETTQSESHPQVVCIAESRDGISWTKPSLGLVAFDGSKDNNIIWDGLGSHNFAPFKDQKADVPPEERYKAMASGEGGLFAFKSPDGLRWSLISDKPVVTEGAFDSQNLGFWDSARGCYVEYHRGFRDGVRDIMTSTSSDFVHWTAPVWLEITGAPPEHLYTNQITPYFRAPQLYFGFPKRFVPSRKMVEHKYEGISDGAFMSSRDGLRFHRWPEAFIRPGLEPDRWVNRNNMTAWGILQTKSDRRGAPDELSLYSTEGYYTGSAVRLRRFTVRMDGFVSVSGPAAGGEMTTKLLDIQSPSGTGDQAATSDERSLLINFSTSAAGSVLCEIQDAKGQPAPGFAASECDEIFGDALERVVTWQGRSDLGALAGQPLRLRVLLKDADLYAIRFR